MVTLFVWLPLYQSSPRSFSLFVLLYLPLVNVAISLLKTENMLALPEQMNSIQKTTSHRQYERKAVLELP